jgi:glycosyltransferase involved in cell wall biosynthesis
MINNGVSVLIPLKGRGEFLGEALYSIATQTYSGRLTVVIVYNDLSDYAKNVIHSFKKFLDIEVYKNSDAGLVSALNFGIEKCKTELIARLDADDLMKPWRIKRQVEFLEMNPEVSVVGSQIEYVDENGILLGTSDYLTGAKRLTKALPHDCLLAHPSVLYRRTAILMVGGYREFFTHAEDYDLWLRLSRVSRLDNLPEVLSSYRIHKGQISTQHIELQAAATLAAQHSYRLSQLNLPDITELFCCMTQWKICSDGFTFSRQTRFFSLRRQLWESGFTGMTITLKVKSLLLFICFPLLTLRLIIRRVRLGITA